MFMLAIKVTCLTRFQIARTHTSLTGTTDVHVDDVCRRRTRAAERTNRR
jgi:hypothetical protein